MSEGPQYTSCVEAADWEPPSGAIIGALAALIVGGSIAAIFSAGIGAVVAIAALVQLLRYVLDFMLNGKLICLHRAASNDCVCGAGGTTVCAIGQVVDTEGVGEDKNPIEDVDNDYAMNIALYPWDIQSFAFGDVAANLATATAADHPQGDLLRIGADMPSTSDDDAHRGYFRTVIYLTTTKEWHAWTEVVGRDYGWFGIVGPDQEAAWGDYVAENAWMLPRKCSVPVLHCEFEGSRIRDMLAVIEAFSFGGGWCKKNWFFRLVCVVLQTLFSPIILAAVAVAWAAASDGDPAAALQGGGTINSKDRVVVRGRWTFDGGHTGWNELHATRVVQKIDNVPADNAGFEAFRKQWCDRLSEVPHIDWPGLHILTPEQQAVADNQQKPEHQWVLHPAVDGCRGEEEEEEEPPPIIK